MSIRVLHAADLHLDSPFEALPAGKAAQRRQEQRLLIARIAQAVKDAMCSDGYSSVADVIKYCRYDGSTSMGTNDACRQAVRYIFDDNHAAVQHRLLYMYNPYLCTSSFHESQRFILSYQGVRFFDRW